MKNFLSILTISGVLSLLITFFVYSDFWNESNTSKVDDFQKIELLSETFIVTDFRKAIETRGHSSASVTVLALENGKTCSVDDKNYTTVNVVNNPLFIREGDVCKVTLDEYNYLETFVNITRQEEISK